MKLPAIDSNGAVICLLVVVYVWGSTNDHATPPVGNCFHGQFEILLAKFWSKTYNGMRQKRFFARTKSIAENNPKSNFVRVIF